jgi:hypothetical protein
MGNPRAFGSPIRSKFIDKLEEATPCFGDVEEKPQRKYSIEVSAFKIDNEVTLGEQNTPKNQA